jgi:type VI secretion system protein ImpH
MRYASDRVSVSARASETLRALGETPWRFDYFHALRLIDALHPHLPRLGTARRPVDEPVRLAQAPELSFAPASLHAVWPATHRTPPRIEVRFFGLFGPNGPLPLHMTEYARERQLHHNDATLTRFADLFHHRLLLLFYRAWAQAQPTVSLDRPAEDRFAERIGSLIGIGSPALRERDAAPDHAKLFFAGLLARQVRNADGLASLLSGYLRRPVRIEPYVGQWLPLPASDRTRIGRVVSGRPNPTARVGAGAVLGKMVWDRQHNFRIHIGPLDRATFESLLPGGSALPALSALVEQYVGKEFGWDLQLTLAREDAKPTQPGRQGQLGWTSWLGRLPGAKPAQLLLSPHAALRTAQRRAMNTAPHPEAKH